MATTERRKSISVFFGFKQEPKPDPMSASVPKLRRKLQKVTKQTDIEAPGISTGAPAQLGRVQTIKLPGDDSFLSTKYEEPALAPLDGSQERIADEAKNASRDKDVSLKDKRASREGKSRFFSRSSSASRVASIATATLPAAFNRTTSSVTNKATHSKSDSVDSGVSFTAPAAVTANKATTTAASPPAINTAVITAAAAPSVPNNSTLSSLFSGNDTDATDAESQLADEARTFDEAHAEARMQKKAAQAATQARTLQLMEAHERASGQELAFRRRSFYGHGANPEAPPPLAAPQVDICNELRPLPLTVSQVVPPAHPSREYTQFHRPYRHSQHQGPPPSHGGDMRWTRQAHQQSFRARRASVAPIAVSTAPGAVLPYTPSSAVSASSSSFASPASIAFSSSSASLSPSSASSVSQSHATSPMSPSDLSPCADSQSGFSDKSFPFASVHHKKNRRIDRPVPELSYLTHANSRGQTAPGSSLSKASAEPSSTKARRKVKTPVHAIGQLESPSTSSHEISNNELKHMPVPNHDPVAVQAARELPGIDSAELTLLQSKSSIECIAEEYRALLVSRGSQFTDAQSEFDADVSQRPISSGHGSSSQHSDRKYIDTLSSAQRKFNLSSMVPHTSDSRTPTADVLVDSPLLRPPVFQEWSNHTSMPAPPLSPAGNKSTSQQLRPLRTPGDARSNNPRFHNDALEIKSPSPPPENLSLQICLDLLTRELSSAVTRRSSPAAAAAAARRAAGRQQQDANRGLHHSVLTSPLSASSLTSGPDSAASALQILVMIEAYERLRDRLVADVRKKAKKRTAGSGSSGSDASAEQIESMFGLWLKALYRIHDTLTYPSEEEESEVVDNTSQSEYDSAEE